MYCKNYLPSTTLRIKEGGACLQISFANDNSITNKQWKVGTSAWESADFQQILNPGTLFISLFWKWVITNKQYRI